MKSNFFSGVSRRGDIEVLLYVLIDWLGGKLPWDVDESLKPTVIQQMKIEAFRDVPTFMKKTFPNGNCPSYIESLMYAVMKIQFEQAPDYEYLRTLFAPFNTPLHENAIKYIDEEDKEVIITKPKVRESYFVYVFLIFSRKKKKRNLVIFLVKLHGKRPNSSVAI